MMQQISKNLTGFDCYFIAHYNDGILDFIEEKGLLESTVFAKENRRKVENYFIKNRLNIDSEKRNDDYDLVSIFSNLATPNNIKNNRVIMIKEEIIDAKKIKRHLANILGVPSLVERSLEQFYLSDTIIQSLLNTKK